MAKLNFVVIDGCPCPRDVSPYVWLVLRRAGQSASSIYRGDDPKAAAILHRYGKHTQREIHADPAYAAISNPSGFSQHDLHDGQGRPIPAWHVGIDSGSDSPAAKEAIERAGRQLGLVIVHPYTRGVEGHHWCFAVEPKPNKRLTRRRVLQVRAQLMLGRG